MWRCFRGLFAMLKFRLWSMNTSCIQQQQQIWFRIVFVLSIWKQIGWNTYKHCSSAWAIKCNKLKLVLVTMCLLYARICRTDEWIIKMNMKKAHTINWNSIRDWFKLKYAVVLWLAIYLQCVFCFVAIICSIGSKVIKF